MKVGDRVRLRRPFQPTSTSPFYRYGVVAGLVAAESSSECIALDEVLLYLYDPGTDRVHTDELGAQVLYGFYTNEVDPL